LGNRLWKNLKKKLHREEATKTEKQNLKKEVDNKRRGGVGPWVWC